MRDARKTPILFLLALVVLAWGCSNGGGSPTAPPSELALAEAKWDCVSKPDHPSCPGLPPGDVAKWDLAIEGITDLTAACTEANRCVTDLEKVSDSKAERGYYAPTFDGAVLAQKIQDLVGSDCVDDLAEWLYTEAVSVEVLRKGGVLVEWQFWLGPSVDDKEWWSLQLTGQFKTDTDRTNFLQPGGNSDISIADALLERGHGKGCSASATNVGTTVQVRPAA